MIFEAILDVGFSRLAEPNKVRRDAMCDRCNQRKMGALIEQLGFAPVQLGKLAEGGLLVQARGKSWAQLIFQDFVKFK